jgi:hypothetical protein
MRKSKKKIREYTMSLIAISIVQLLLFTGLITTAINTPEDRQPAAIVEQGDDQILSTKISFDDSENEASADKNTSEKSQEN